jgi:hypothetical protein
MNHNKNTKTVSLFQDYHVMHVGAATTQHYSLMATPTVLAARHIHLVVKVVAVKLLLLHNSLTTTVTYSLVNTLI